MAKLSDLTGRSVCDSCKETFESSKVLLKPAARNFSVVGRFMFVVNCDGKIIRTDKFEAGDQTLHCPLCEQVHLLGFDNAE